MTTHSQFARKDHSSANAAVGKASLLAAATSKRRVKTYTQSKLVKIYLYGLLTVCFGFLLSVSPSAEAQSYRYMDESGNIYFVDRLDQVPLRYRNQIPGLAPTPEYVENGRGKKDKRKQPKNKKEQKKKPPKVKTPKPPKERKNKGNNNRSRARELPEEDEVMIAERPPLVPTLGPEPTLEEILPPPATSEPETEESGPPSQQF